MTANIATNINHLQFISKVIDIHSKGDSIPPYLTHAVVFQKH